MGGDGRIEVRSYRTVFDLERRLYRIDRVRLNPGGVPVRGVVYGVVLTVVVAVLAGLPVLGWPLRALPWPARHLLLPTVLAAALTVVRVDGRPCHVALRSLIELAIGPRRIDAWERVPRSPERWRPTDLVVIPDGSEAGLRRACFRGPERWWSASRTICDDARLQHAGRGYSAVDFNRAGVPLMEIVTEPDIRSPAQARAYGETLRDVLRYIGASEGDMETGSMRIEGNVSLRPMGTDTFGTKVEVKNLNSFRSLERAMEYEVERQAEALERDERLTQETRGWDENGGRTISQRSKEEANDYRYFPEPDSAPAAPIGGMGGAAAPAAPRAARRAARALRDAAGPLRLRRRGADRRRGAGRLLRSCRGSGIERKGGRELGDAASSAGS